MATLHVSLVALVDFADLSLGMLMIHAFTFDPAWVRPRPAVRQEIVFFDGGCGLCHRAVRFVLGEDVAGRFVFAPLGGELFRAVVSADTERRLPDSLVVRMADGTLLTRWTATRHVLASLGGVWRIVAGLAAPVPAVLGDRLYAAVAGRRRRFFRRPATACPLVPAGLRWRFEA
jgi:predicted DCC family thiol-disulfide oxidoreductase YuxK